MTMSERTGRASSSPRFLDCQKLGQGIQRRGSSFPFKSFSTIQSALCICKVDADAPLQSFQSPLRLCVLSLPPPHLSHILSMFVSNVCIHIQCVCVCSCFEQRGGSDGVFKKGNLEELREQLNRCKKDLQQAHDE